jgi:hypothetical protein
MLTKEGLAALKLEKEADYLAMHRATFAPTAWRDADSSDVKCSATTGSCTYSAIMVPPSVAAVWVRTAPSLAAPDGVRIV